MSKTYFVGLRTFKNTKHMSRITKTLAQQVADKLAMPLHAKFRKLEKELSELVTSEYEATLPKDLLTAFKKYPKYFSSATYLNVSGPGLPSYSSFTLCKALPTLKEGYNRLTVSPETANKFVDLEDKISKLKQEYREHKREIEIAVFGLRTYGKVQLEFPEAYAVLPPITTTALTVDLKKIRCKIDRKNCV